MNASNPHFGVSKPGFTLMEILVAIGVFALGAVAVASIFPTAIFLQRQTIADVELRQFSYNVEGLVNGRSIRFADGGGFETAYETATTAAGGVPQISPLNIASTEDLLAEWSLRDRTFPANYAPANARTVFAPLMYDKDDSAAVSWILYAFVLERQSGETYNTLSAADPDWATADGASFPSVRRVPLSVAPSIPTGGFLVSQFTVADGVINDYLLAPGVEIMDNNGVTYVIDRVDQSDGTQDLVIVEGFIPASPATATGLWIGDPGTASRNPTRGILVFVDSDPELEPKAPATPTHHVVP